MKPTHALTAALGLLLLASQGAFAHEGHPRSIEMTYRESSSEVLVTFHSTYVMDNALVNLCVAKDTLPSDWQDGPPAPLSTAKQCKETPLFGGLGYKFLDVRVGDSVYAIPSQKAATLESGRHVVSVILFNDVSPPGHHEDGKHGTLKLVDFSRTDDD